MRIRNYRERLLARERMAGTFVKTPAIEVIEVLAGTELDFVCLDAEHSGIDRGRMDACLAIARALDFPVMVRVASGAPENILQALDGGAVGVVVPHVDSVEKARAAARAAHFGKGGRGFANSTRWAGYNGAPMEETLRRSREETAVIVQIEEPEGVEAAAEIAGTEGIDGLFIGPADLSVSYGKTELGSDELWQAFETVGAATKAAGKAFVSFAGNAAAAAAFVRYGVTVFYIGSELGFMAGGANATAAEVRALE
jgi:2-keto-3-deoxy-L-rhamnonate aldolase RhmA